MSCTALIKYLFTNDRILRMVEEEWGQLFTNTNKNTNIERWLKKGEVIYSQMQAHFQPLKLDTIYCCSFSKTSSSNSSSPYTEPHHDTVKYNLQDYCVKCELHNNLSLLIVGLICSLVKCCSWKLFHFQINESPSKRALNILCMRKCPAALY